MITTKTFIENRWYARTGPQQFEELSESRDAQSIDAQVKEWVERTGSVIVHPGQLGMHTTWRGDKDDPFKLKCLTFGLTVLYQEKENGGE
jgi:hypothetical protein